MKFLAVPALLATAAPALGSAQGFYNTCRDIHIGRQLSRHVEMYLTCKQKDGRWGADTKYYLNDAVANDNGQLNLRANGGFSGSCRECWFEAHSAWLTCICKRTNGSEIRSRVDLDRVFTNNDGVAWAYGVPAIPR